MESLKETRDVMDKQYEGINTFKYHVFAPMGRFQLELIYKIKVNKF